MDYAKCEALPPPGYTIIKGVLSPEKCEELAHHFARRTVDMVFTERGFDISKLSTEEALELLTTPAKRREHFGEQANESVWRNGNSRNPVHSKSCGMIHLHYDKHLLEDITFNEDLYEQAAKIYGCKELVHLDGLERICVKPRGSTDMPQHIDANLFLPEVNFDTRIQSLVTLQIDTNPKTKTRDTGTICLIPHFHRYWDFAARLLHPTKGLNHSLMQCRMENPPKGRFFALPTGNEGWDKKYFPLLQLHIKSYSDYIHRGARNLPEETLAFYRKIDAEGITIPNDPPRILEEIVWTPIKLEPGDMIWWHQHLPHRSLRNTTKTPRIVAYGVWPVEKGWYRSDEQRWLATQTMSLEFYYPRGRTVGLFPTALNSEELNHLRRYPEEMAALRGWIADDSQRRKMAGQESWFGESDGTVEDDETGKVYTLGPDGKTKIEWVV